MRPIIWYRTSIAEQEELQAAQKYFTCVDSRVKIQKNDFVISRYSLLPYFAEQQYDVEECIGAKLINSVHEHYFIADMRNWIETIPQFTPKTWYRIEDVPDNEDPYILKGETNSRKDDFFSKMYARDLEQAKQIHWDLCKDPLMKDSEQDIYIRKFEPLVKLMDNYVGGPPVSKEFRVFVAYKTILSKGFYWSNYVDDLPEAPDVNEIPDKWLNSIIDIVGNHTNFFVVDVAQKQNGEWIVIELNSGNMSGLSCCDPGELYKNLRMVVDKHLAG